jgi:hypothetical protein
MEPQTSINDGLQTTKEIQADQSTILQAEPLPEDPRMDKQTERYTLIESGDVFLGNRETTLKDNETDNGVDLPNAPNNYLLFWHDVFALANSAGADRAALVKLVLHCERVIMKAREPDGLSSADYIDALESKTKEARAVLSAQDLTTH